MKFLAKTNNLILNLSISDSHDKNWLTISQKIKGTFPNCEIALWILMTTPVTWHWAYKVKTIQKLFTHLHVAGKTGLILLSIEKIVALRVNFKDVIAEFGVKLR